MSRILAVAFLVLPVCLYSYPQTPIQIDPAVAAQHLLNHPEPVYPPKAIAAHIQGTVTMKIIIDKTGHVASVRVIGGPPMLRDAAVLAVRRFTYKPFEQGRIPVTAGTTASVNFVLNVLNERLDEREEDPVMRLYQAQTRCDRLLRAGSAPANQVDACLKAVQDADALPHNSHLSERQSAYIGYSKALISAGRFNDAIVAGRRAVSLVMPGMYDLEGISDTAHAYAIYGEALALSGNLPDADKSLAKAEGYQRDAMRCG